MISVFLREQHHYSFEELEELFKKSSFAALEILKTLKHKGLVKIVKRFSEQAENNDFLFEENIRIDTLETVFFVFTYVGIVVVKDVVLKFYPKYLKKSSTPIQQLKQALRVIEKYNARTQEINLYDAVDDKETGNKLAIMIYLLKDYFDYGLYSNIKDIVDENGNGEILWEKTINETYALLSHGKPYYPLFYTRRHVTDERDFFRRLHTCILHQIFTEFEVAELTELFDIARVPISEDKLEDLGDMDYLLYRLEREYDIQFNTRKQQLLLAMSSYIADKDITSGENNSVSMYGTTSFNLVWENVCNAILGDQRYSPMGILPLPHELDKKYGIMEPLISVIDRPSWNGISRDGSVFSKMTDKTLIPDFLAIQKTEGKYSFIILDAKYYNLEFEAEKPLIGQPGIEAITKQYLYELAYKDFMQRNHIEIISNCFLFPTEETTIQIKGYVELNFLQKQGLHNISIRLLPASKAFEYYLSDRKLAIEDLHLDFGEVNCETIERKTKT